MPPQSFVFCPPILGFFSGLRIARKELIHSFGASTCSVQGIQFQDVYAGAPILPFSRLCCKPLISPNFAATYLYLQSGIVSMSILYLRRQDTYCFLLPASCLLPPSTTLPDRLGRTIRKGLRPIISPVIAPVEASRRCSPVVSMSHSPCSPVSSNLIQSDPILSLLRAGSLPERCWDNHDGVVMKHARSHDINTGRDEPIPGAVARPRNQCDPSAHQPCSAQDQT